MPIGTAAAIIGAAAIGGGASILGSSKAASAQQKAAAQADALQREQFAQTRSDLAPYRDTGSTALSSYSALLGQRGPQAYQSALSNYTESPFLAQLVNRTRDSVEASRAAKGGLNSGGTLQQIGDRTGELYLGDFNNYLSRLGGLADTGQNAAAQTGNFGANAAAGRANSIMAGGNAKAGGYIDTANSFNNFLGQAAGAYGAYKGGSFGNNYTTPDGNQRGYYVTR